MKVAIIGAGAIGKAMESALKKARGISVGIYDSNPENSASKNSLEGVVTKAEIVFLCVPSQAETSAIKEILPFLPENAGVVSFAKGIEVETGAFMDEVLQKQLPRNQPFGFFGGPMLSKEVLLGKGGVGIIGSHFPSFRKKLARIFHKGDIRIETTDDARGVALAGMLKNVYACAMGITEGLLWGNNKRGWLGSLAFTEMLALTELLGGKQQTFLGASGIGDFLATGFGATSRNRKMGEDMAKHGRIEYKAESFYSIAPLAKLMRKHSSTLPLLFALEAVMNRKKSAVKIFSNLFTKKNLRF